MKFPESRTIGLWKSLAVKVCLKIRICRIRSSKPQIRARYIPGHRSSAAAGKPDLVPGLPIASRRLPQNGNCRSVGNLSHNGIPGSGAASHIQRSGCYRSCPLCSITFRKCRGKDCGSLKRHQKTQAQCQAFLPMFFHHTLLYAFFCMLKIALFWQYTPYLL